ncbi:MAG: AAA family ATPase [Anaerolineae bacterium]|nr:AAA family ATPase [Anaerolineae bacterium]
MLEKWILENFKSVPKRTTLNFAPLTLLVGPNSSGKSSLIQSILLVTQTLKGTSGKYQLVLNGELVKLGNAQDILHEGQEQLPMTLGCIIKPRKASSLNDRKSDFQGIPLLSDAQIYMKMQFSTISGKVGGDLFALEKTEVHQGRSGISARKLVPNERLVTDPTKYEHWHVDLALKAQLKQGTFDYVIEEISSNEQISEYRSKQGYQRHLSVQYFLPKAILELYNRPEMLEIQALTQAAGALTRETSITEEINFNAKYGERIRRRIQDALHRAEKEITGEKLLQELRVADRELSRSNTLTEWIEKLRKDISNRNKTVIARGLRYTAADRKDRLQDPKEDEIGLRTINLPSDLLSATQNLVSYFSERVQYLGPLRDDPRAIYNLPPTPESINVGIKGQFTAAVLEHYKNLEIKYPSPPTHGGIYGQIKTAPLITAVTEWLRHMGLVETVTTRERGKMGYELTVRAVGTEKDVDLTSVGVGVSQVLPTLVMSLLAPTNSTLLFEQPEVHLHPKVQSVLGDFFIGLINFGYQCIIETHSEYLVNRIRRRIAESEGNTLSDLIHIYFVERTGKSSNFNLVETNEFGALPEWPKGFFDEGPSEAQLIMQAAMKKREKSRDLRPRFKR